METQTISLNVHPQIIDLYEVLEKNGLHKQKEDVQSLVGYIESMEYNLSVMMNEIQEMHAEVNLLHDKGIRAKCAKIVTKAEDKILQVGTMVSVAKGKVVADGPRDEIFGNRTLLKEVGIRPPEIFSMGQALEERALCYTVEEFTHCFGEGA